MINSFWNWLTSGVNAALSWLNTMYNNSIMNPFFQLFIVVFSTIVVTKYIIYPLLTGGSGKSDKAKKNKGDEE